MRFEGKTIVITGGSSGIGRGTVDLFLREGANVVMGDIDADEKGDSPMLVVQNRHRCSTAVVEVVQEAFKILDHCTVFGVKHNFLRRTRAAHNVCSIRVFPQKYKLLLLIRKFALGTMQPTQTRNKLMIMRQQSISHMLICTKVTTHQLCPARRLWWHSPYDAAGTRLHDCQGARPAFPTETFV